MPDVLSEYLVRLGFSTDIPAFQQLKNAMETAERSVTEHTSGMTRRLLEWQGAAVGAFDAVSGAIVTMVDKVAMADQGYRLMGERMLMSTDQARKMDMVTKALGASLEEIVWDPELSARAKVMAADIDRMTHGLGPGFESNMKGIRDMRMEFSRLGVGMKFLGMGFVSDLFTKLFPNKDVLGTLTTWVTKFEEKIPELSDKLSTYAVPILKETWRIFKDLGEVVKEGAIAFQNIIGLFSGDKAIEGTTLNFDTMAKSVEHVTHLIEKLLSVFIDAEKTIAHTSAALSLLLHGDVAGASKEMGQALTPVRLDENGKPIIDQTTGQPKKESLWESIPAELIGASLGINLLGGALKAGGKFLKAPIAVAKAPFKLAKWVGRLGKGAGAAEGAAVGATEAAGAAAGAGEAVAGGAAAAGAEAGGTGLLSMLGPVGWTILGGIGLNWAARSIFPKFKQWENNAVSGIFGGGKPAEETPESGGGQTSGLDWFTKDYFVPFVRIFESFSKQFDIFAARFTGAPSASPMPSPAGTGAAAAVAAAQAEKPPATQQPQQPFTPPLGMDSSLKGWAPRSGAEPPKGAGQLSTQQFLDAIAGVESGGKANALSIRNNNAGNLMIGSQYRKYLTKKEGDDEALAQINRNIGRGLTLNEFFAGKPGVYPGWAPADDGKTPALKGNNPAAYAARVAKQLHIDPNVPLNRMQWTPIPSAQASGGMKQNVTIALGGIYITQPNADPQQIQRAVADGTKKALDSSNQWAQVQLMPAWG